MEKWRRFGCWLDAVAIKTVKTMAETAVGVLAGCALLQEIDWKFIISACIVSGLVTMLTNIDTLPNKDPSLIYNGDEIEEDINE